MCSKKEKEKNMEQFINISDIIIAISACIAAIGAIGGTVFSIYRWIMRQKQQDEDIKALKNEQRIIVKGVFACLKGLHEQGCNGAVTSSISEFESYLNDKAHQ